MRVLHLCYADDAEGGAIGAYRLHKSMLDYGVDSKLLVIRKRRETGVGVVQAGLLTRIMVSIWMNLTKYLLRLQGSRYRVFRSMNIFPTGIHRYINNYAPDILQMHWINNNTISIREIGRIDCPVVWKLPDMWAFCGTEHYVNDAYARRYTEGYSRGNRDADDTGLDIDRFVWRYKSKCWERKGIAIVCPSSWLMRKVKESKLLGDNKVTHILNPLDLDLFRSCRSRALYERYGLDPNFRYILFGSVKALKDPRKGYQHLDKALKQLGNEGLQSHVALIIFGNDKAYHGEMHGFHVHALGNIRDEQRLAEVYSLADVVVLPTENDNLPNIIKEAMACGTPCVSFNVGGLPDMVDHRQTGYLATPFEYQGLVDGIKWVLDQPNSIREIVRRKAVDHHSPEKKVKQYLNYYAKIKS